MSIHEFKQRPRVDTELGSGHAVLVETGAEDAMWTVILDNGAPVTFPQNKIRFHRNYTIGRNFSADAMRKAIALPKKQR